MGLLKKNNGHKTLFGKIAGGVAKVAAVAAPVAATVAGGPAGGLIGGKVGGFLGKLSGKVKKAKTSLQTLSEKVEAQTGGQVNIRKIMPQKGETLKQLGARYTKGLGGAASGFAQQATLPVPANAENNTFEENLQSGFVGNRLPSWILYVVGAVAAAFVVKKLIN